MVPRIEISTPSRWEPPRIPWRMTTGLHSPSPSPRRHRFAEVQQDDEDEDKSDVSEMIDELESSASGESDGDAGGVGWDERLNWWKVYAFHFLFMWNSNTIEYVSIFLVASAFPDSLTASSIKGITSTVSGLLFSSAVGNWIDRSPSRLRTLLITICFNHAAAVIQYLLWLSWPVTAEGTTPSGGPFSNLQKGFLFGTILLFDMIHDLAAIGNRLSLERDWVPVLVGPIKSDLKYDLTGVNSVMVRIDLICKLVAPSLLPILISVLSSRAAWISVIAASTLLFWAIEVWCALIIAKENPELDIPKVPSDDMATAEDIAIEDRYQNLDPGWNTLPQRLYFILYQDPAVRLRHYFLVSMWPASIAAALLQLTVLAYSATLITYLLEIGFSLSSITIAKASGSIMSLLSTVITPAIVSFKRKRLRRKEIRGIVVEVKDNELEGKVIRTVGLWGISFQFLCMIPVVIVLWILSPKSQAASTTASDTASMNPIIPVTLFAFLSLSRVGHYMIHLMVQELGQVEIVASQRSTFAGTEQSFNSLFGLCHWAATAVLNQPEQFRFLAMASLGVAAVAVAVFAKWEREPMVRGEMAYENIALGEVLHEDDRSEDEREDEDDEYEEEDEREEAKILRTR